MNEAQRLTALLSTMDHHLQLIKDLIITVEKITEFVETQAVINTALKRKVDFLGEKITRLENEKRTHTHIFYPINSEDEECRECEHQQPIGYKK